MAKGKELAKLIPKSIQVSVDGGDDVLVATTAEGNKILNYFVAAQIRDFLQRAIKRYNDEDVKPSPKDIRDLAEAGRSLAEFSAKLYEGEEAVLTPKAAEPAKPDEALDFENLNKKPDDSPASKVSP